jgi:hypothetical protein
MLLTRKVEQIGAAMAATAAHARARRRQAKPGHGGATATTPPWRGPRRRHRAWKPWSSEITNDLAHWATMASERRRPRQIGADHLVHRRTVTQIHRISSPATA